MDIVEQWTLRIAQLVTPDETDFAADVGAAYAAGGKARKSLMARHNVQPGAFAPGASAAELPMILQSLAHCGHQVVALLRGPYIGDTLSAGSLLAIVKLSRDRRRMEAPGAASAIDVVPLAPAAAAGQLTERQAIGRVLESMSDRLTSAGFAPARADQIACGLISELLADSAGGVSFVDALTAVPPGDADRPGSADAPDSRGGAGRRWPRRGSQGP